jgi:ATP-dependent Clp protease protease subunit
MAFWNFIKNEENLEEVELRIEGEIVSDDDAWIYEWFGIPAATPNAFRQALAEHSGKNINVWIDSWGGDTTAAAGIYNALKEHKGKVTVKIDGKAVSAASVIAMAGEEIHISPVGIMMIHNPWSSIRGAEAKDMRHMADVLDEVKESIINAYQAKTGRSRKKISEMMDNEFWMSARTAKAEGFVDEILYSGAGEADTIENSFMLSGLAIQNSVRQSMDRLFDGYAQKLKEMEKRKDPDGILENKPEPVKQVPVDIYQKQILINRRKANV